MANLLEALAAGSESGTVVGDALVDLPAARVLEDADAAAAIHRSAAAAGARVLRCAAWLASPPALAAAGLGGRANEVNWRAARAVRRVADETDGAYAAGCVGPLALPSGGSLSAKERQAAYREQIGAQLDGGCGSMVLQGFGDLAELLVAVNAFQNLTNVPLIASVAVDARGRLAGSGETLADAWARLRAAAVDILGTESGGPDVPMEEVVAAAPREADDTVAAFLHGPARIPGAHLVAGAPGSRGWDIRAACRLQATR